jgi:hypothetical protein
MRAADCGKIKGDRTMKRRIIAALLAVALLCAGCANEVEILPETPEIITPPEETITPSETTTQPKNTVVQNPVMNEITYEISEKLVGRYVAENDPDMYFEIKSNGELEISLHTFSGYSRSTSESFYLKALYTEAGTLISFQRVIGNRNTFSGGFLAIDFKGDVDCTYFRSATYLSFDYIRFNKEE